MKKVFKNLFKVAVVLVLLWVLARQGLLSLDRTRAAFQHIDKILIAFGIVFGLSFLGALRWYWLLQAQGIQMRFWRAFQLAYVGNFFNTALPGAVSGDIVKAWYVAKEVKGRKSFALGSILFDRIVGLSALVFVSAGALVVGYDQLHDQPLMIPVLFFVKSTAAVVFLFYVYLFLVHEDRDPLLRVLKWLESKVSKLASVTRIYLSVRSFHHHRWTVIKALFVSIIIHLMIGFVLWNLAQALEAVTFSMVSLYAVFPVGMLVTAIPVAPAGIGTGHYAFAKLFQLLHSEGGADTYTLYAMLQLTMGALGGLTYLQFKSHGDGMSLAKLEEDEASSTPTVSERSASSVSAR